jgi:hypothetical protein
MLFFQVLLRCDTLRVVVVVVVVVAAGPCCWPLLLALAAGLITLITLTSHALLVLERCFVCAPLHALIVSASQCCAVVADAVLSSVATLRYVARCCCCYCCVRCAALSSMRCAALSSIASALLVLERCFVCAPLHALIVSAESVLCCCC